MVSRDTSFNLICTLQTHFPLHTTLPNRTNKLCVGLLVKNCWTLISEVHNKYINRVNRAFYQYSHQCLHIHMYYRIRLPITHFHSEMMPFTLNDNRWGILICPSTHSCIEINNTIQICITFVGKFSANAIYMLYHQKGTHQMNQQQCFY